MSTTEDLVEVQSRLSPHGTPMLGDCVLHLNDGNDRIVFQAGRATAPARLAEALARRSDVIVMQAYQAPVEESLIAVPAAPPAPVEQELAPNTEQPPAPAGDVSPDVLAAMEHLKEEGVDVPPVLVTTEPAAGTGEGAQVGEVTHPEGSTPLPAPVTVPDGFEATTPDGQPRCLAAKADGSQCANAARGDAHACQMPAHIAKLTAS